MKTQTEKKDFEPLEIPDQKCCEYCQDFENDKQCPCMSF